MITAGTVHESSYAYGILATCMLYSVPVLLVVLMHRW